MTEIPANHLLILVAAMVISMTLIPVMVRLAPVLGMVDKPDPRKVHSVPIPRVGGVGIVIGSLVPLLVWLPVDTLMASYLAGALILLLFGAWDDAKELGHYVKFIGQFAAVLGVVYWGDLYVTQLPLLGPDAMSESMGRVFTVIAMVGMINAMNHSDGLDGLAGGESLISLLAIIYLAYQAGGDPAVIIAVATIGGVFGFLRFNSHPARVFMGDGGSQFLGFTLAFLAVYLMTRVNPALSPALPLLFLGLPIVDILAVFAQRIYHGMNWFRATKNHIHHRLLELGFEHHESVITIYAIQALLVLLAVVLPYEHDLLIIGIYVGVSVAVFAGLIVAERSGWRKSRERLLFPAVKAFGVIRKQPQFLQALTGLVMAVIALYALVVAFVVEQVPLQFGYILVVLAGLLLARLLAGFRLWFLFLRLTLFLSMAALVYLVNLYPQPWFAEVSRFFDYAVFAVLILAIAAGMRFAENSRFDVSPLDFLVILMLLVAGIFPQQIGLSEMLLRLIIEFVVLFYAVEWVLKHMRSRWNLMTLGVLGSLVVLSGRFVVG
ncbi:undecaprenyl-phosphate alpha-N-acetylglucosaminyl 1-phosphate transferase [Thiohalobacter thiocyanaticus]|uniref:Undecaprenyl-phosphate alpha-N-acetylglucosaminyl 1-phosphate transferase n=1 Tax=Thiohalobacter thiocyanaticus TaxID=585455 RepID=A0A1Z4VNI8_9GAMM|nr:MraY family glycosyltransferase [Thiohalobacter thiocyanaticus]BAZ92992.1 undecaprenyl-phosphate alpha-N-acetylglucosaminyl 1-phosphate transferase [Thiohalobacter thiocyanaticus]